MIKMSESNKLKFPLSSVNPHTLIMSHTEKLKWALWEIGIELMQLKNSLNTKSDQLVTYCESLEKIIGLDNCLDRKSREEYMQRLRRISSDIGFMTCNLSFYLERPRQMLTNITKPLGQTFIVFEKASIPECQNCESQLTNKPFCKVGRRIGFIDVLGTR